MKLRARLKMLEKLFGLWKPKPPEQVDLVTEYVTCGKRDADDQLERPPEAVSGCVDHPDAERINRNPGESVEAFTSRLQALPGRKEKLPREIYLFGPENPPAA